MASSNLSGDLSVMRNRGRVGIIGSRNEPTPVNPRDTMARELDILGVFQGSATPAEQAEGRAALLEALEAGTLRPVVGMRLPLEEASKAHAEVMAPSAGGAAGNVVLVVAEEEL